MVTLLLETTWSAVVELALCVACIEWAGPVFK